MNTHTNWQHVLLKSIVILSEKNESLTGFEAWRAWRLMQMWLIRVGIKVGTNSITYEKTMFLPFPPPIPINPG